MNVWNLPLPLLLLLLLLNPLMPAFDDELANPFLTPDNINTTKSNVALMRLLAAARRGLGKEREAARLEKQLDEVESQLEIVRQTAVAETRYQLDPSLRRRWRL
jgi:hypothetical protein